MVYLNSFEKHLEEIKIKEILEFIDLSINESAGSQSTLTKVFSKIKNLSESAKRRVLKYAIVSLLAFDSVTNVIRIIQNSNIPKEDKRMAIEVVQNQKEDEEEKKDAFDKYKAGYEFDISEAGISHIKKEEALRLVAYKLGDGRITVGYGHAEKPGKTKLKVGEKITKKEAEELFKKDIDVATSGVKRIFNEWEKKGLEIKITQKMFDALVSIAFNTGVSSLRKSDVIQHLKKGDYELAADSIKSFKVSSKFPGLSKRRSAESQMFSIDLNI